LIQLRPLLRLVFALTACLVPAAANAQAARCPVPPSASWTATEAWVWSNLCTGYVADLTTLDAAPVAMQGPAPWPADRTLSAEFLYEILTDPRYSLGQISPGPMIISGARFTDPVKIINADLKNELILDSSRFDGGLDIEDSASSDGLFLRHDAFGGPINIQRSSFQMLWLRTGSAPAMNISGDNFASSVLIESATIPGSLDITATKIGNGGLTFQSAHRMDSQIGQLAVVGSTIDGETSISDAHFAREFEVGDSSFGEGLEINHASFAALAFFQDADFGGSVDVSDASFNDDLRFGASKFSGSFNLEDDSLCLRQPRCELFLVDANFGGGVVIRHTLINGDLDADGVTASSAFELFNDGDAQYPLNVKMIGANFTRDLTVDSTILAGLQLANSNITGRLTLFLPQSASWAKNSWLSLKGTNIGVLSNYYWNWPSIMSLDGMQFGSIDRPAIRFDKRCIGGGWSHWLNGMVDYSPQPYQEVAKYLSNNGDTEDAACVLETREARLNEHRVGLQKLGYWAYGLVAGYGYAPAQAFYSVALFVVIGMLVLRLTGEGKKHGIPIGLFYSLSQLVPLVSLDKRFDDIELAGPARYYFYLHKIAGWFIAGFLTAALTGLTTKGLT
jgi:hypothetical protein